MYVLLRAGECMRTYIRRTCALMNLLSQNLPIPKCISQNEIEVLSNVIYIHRPMVPAKVFFNVAMYHNPLNQIITIDENRLIQKVYQE